MGKPKNETGRVQAANPKKFTGPEYKPWWQYNGFMLLWLAIIAFALFGQTLGFTYTYLDDQTLILGSMEKLKSFSYLPNAFTEDVFHSPTGHGFYYRPILTLTFMADAMTGGGNLAMFHFSNIVYHILATFLLFLFFLEAGFDRIRSMLFAMIFLVHPMLAQAVAWIPGRNDTLLAIFALGSFLSGLKFVKSGSISNLLWHLILFALALLTKENAVVIPILMVLYGIFFLHAPLKKFALPGAGWAVITIVWAVVRYHALGGDSGVPLSIQVQSMVRNLPAVLPFLGKAMFPVDLSVFPILADMTVSTILGIGTIAVLIIVVYITSPKQWFFLFFGLLWFLAFLVPSFVSINNQIPNFSEHRCYLSLAGILMIFMAYDPVKKTSFKTITPVSVVLGICLLFSILTLLHTRHFKNRFTFWQNAIETSPSHAFNYNNLGAMYFLEGDLEKAEPLFRKALQINPREPMANSNTGLVCMRTDRPAEAEKYYLEEIRFNPSYDHAYYNLGLLYYNNSRYDEGIRLWEKLLTINPSYADAYKALLFAYQKLDRKADYERIALMAKEKGLTP